MVKNGNSQFIGDGKSQKTTDSTVQSSTNRVKKKTLLNWIVEVSLLGSISSGANLVSDYNI